MKSRIIASLAAAGLVLMTATGCNMVTTQATTFEYTASDGVNLPRLADGGLEVRNALVVADQDGAEGNLVAVLANTSADAQTLSVDWGTGDASFDVPAGETVSLGSSEEPYLISDLDVLPGSTVSMFFQPGDAEAVELEVPVLDNCLTEYADLAPNDPADNAEACAPVKTVDESH
ncbi:MAG: DNA modification methylase [Candidatus Microbacterium stercoravium]